MRDFSKPKPRRSKNQNRPPGAQHRMLSFGGGGSCRCTRASWPQQPRQTAPTHSPSSSCQPPGAPSTATPNPQHACKTPRHTPRTPLQTQQQQRLHPDCHQHRPACQGNPRRLTPLNTLPRPTPRQRCPSEQETWPGVRSLHLAPAGAVSDNPPLHTSRTLTAPPTSCSRPAPLASPRPWPGHT